MSTAQTRTEDLGAFLLKHRKITGKQLAECLQMWNQTRSEGQPATLHELLVRRGLISMPGIKRLLDEQNVQLSTCPSCGRARVGGEKMDWCAECHKPFEPLPITTMHDGTGPVPSRGGGAEQGEPQAELTIDGYEIVRELGRGGMGEVVLARAADGSEVAVKLLSLDLRGSQVPFKRFAREGRVLANMQHPNLVKTLDVNLTSDPPYLVMEYVDGITLEQFLDQRGYDVEVGIELVQGAIAGVEAVHAEGIIHRDLKPANIMIDRRAPGNLAKVTDFGLAKVMDSNSLLTRTGQSIGTPAYMAPEQIRGELKLMGPATDVYSLGVMLYKVLVGRLPYEGMTMTEVLRRSLKENIPRPESTRYRVSRALADVCEKATRNKLEERYASAQAFLDDLTRALAGGTVEAPAPASAPAPPRASGSGRVRARSNRAKAEANKKGCAGALLALAAGGAGLIGLAAALVTAGM